MRGLEGSGKGNGELTLFLVRTAPRREFHPVVERCVNCLLALLLALASTWGGLLYGTVDQGIPSAILGACRSARSSGIRPFSPRRACTRETTAWSSSGRPVGGLSVYGRRIVGVCFVELVSEGYQKGERTLAGKTSVKKVKSS